jgi:type I restriction enzyme S subunit
MQLTVDSEQLPVGWKVKKLDELCEIARGGSPRPIKQFLTNNSDGVNWIKISDASASSKYIYKTKEKITPDGIKHSRLVSEGDFILSNSMSFGRPYIMRTSGCIHDGWLVLKDKSGLFDQDYLYYFLGSNTTYKQFDKLAAGSTVRNLNIDLVRGVKVILPPLPEQKRIVAILDEAFEGIDRAIANTEKNLANSGELFESYLNAIFTQKGDRWKKKTLQEISIKFTRGKSKHRPRGDKKLYGGKYPLIQTGDISNAKHRITTYSQTYNELGLAQSEIWPQGTVCIAIVGANVAETAILDFDACFPDSVIGIVVNEEVADSNYVEYLLQSFKTELKEKGKGTARDNINLGTFANERFPFPDAKTQKIIACQLKELSFETQRLETIYRQKIAALNELKQSILQKAFTGELTADKAKTVKEEIAA